MKFLVLDGRFSKDNIDDSNNKDLLSYDEELKIIDQLMSDISPSLNLTNMPPIEGQEDIKPDTLQKMAKDIAFVINHDSNLTKFFLGFSAEDDPEYDGITSDFYTIKDQKSMNRNSSGRIFFDPHEGFSGKIKINFTEKFMLFSKLGSEIATNNQELLKGFHGFCNGIIAHELLHAYQYHRRPTKNITWVAEGKGMKDGIVSSEIIEEGWHKIECEHQAFQLSRIYWKEAHNEIKKFADAFAEYEKNNPHLFEEGARYSLLSSKKQNPMVDRYLREEMGLFDKGREFGGAADIVYHSMVVPAEVVVKLNNINTQIKNKVTTKESSETEVQKLITKWKKYMENKKLSQAIKKSFPFLLDVEQRYKAEIDQYNN